MSSFEGWEPLAIVAIFLFLVWSVGVRIALVLSQIRKLGDSERDIMALLKRAAFGMSGQAPEQEAQKVAYLLETIGSRMDRDTYRRMLEQIQVGIAASLRVER